MSPNLAVLPERYERVFPSGEARFAASGGGCTGQCCAVFTLSLPASHMKEPCASPEHDFTAAMLIPISLPDAIERLNALSMTPAPWFTEERELWQCRHWDEDVNRCREYDQRPSFCRSFPGPDFEICPYCGDRP